ncbi:MAG: GlsB/YeaQ/YmgE family stress response membrane protein [Planctomycetes bacterium]|nr:GlsB/YeaQ/YmgE family stress response membrane protein [Planctomycetota bacterium]
MQNNHNNLIALAGRPLDEHVRPAQPWLGATERERCEAANPSSGEAQPRHKLLSTPQPTGPLPLSRVRGSQGSTGPDAPSGVSVPTPRPEVSRRCFLPPSPPAGPGRGQILPAYAPYSYTPRDTVEDSGEWPAVTTQRPAVAAIKTPQLATPLWRLLLGFLISPLLMGLAWWIALSISPNGDIGGRLTLVTLLMSLVCGAVCARFVHGRRDVPASGCFATGALYTFVGAAIFGLVLGGFPGAFVGAVCGIPCGILGATGGVLAVLPEPAP